MKNEIIYSYFIRFYYHNMIISNNTKLLNLDIKNELTYFDIDIKNKFTEIYKKTNSLKLKKTINNLFLFFDDNMLENNTNQIIKLCNNIQDFKEPVLEYNELIILLQINDLNFLDNIPLNFNNVNCKLFHFINDKIIRSCYLNNIYTDFFIFYQVLLLSNYHKYSGKYYLILAKYIRQQLYTT